MSRKSVLGAVCASNGAFAAVARRIAAGQQQHRSFTSTAQRYATIPHFTPTSSPELDSLLGDIRTKIILPSYLPKSQRKKMYSAKWEKQLQSDPIIIEIDGEVFKFRYQNPLTDLPNTRKSLVAAISQFETADDFSNLKPLLEGMCYTGRKISHSFYAKLAWTAGKKGHIYSIIDCARSARQTGYKLDTSEKVNEVLHYVQLKARDADWDEAETKQALRWAEMVVEMLQEEVHQPKRHKMNAPLPGELPLSRDPMVLAAPLHLAAVLVAQHEAGEEVLDKVHKLARDIVTLWPEGRKLKEVQPAELYTRPWRMEYLESPGKFTTIASPLLHGLDTAIKVVEPELADQLRTRRDMLAAEIEEARKELAVLKEARDVKAAEVREAGGTPYPTDFRGELVYQKFCGA
ncbi:hypothetical protein F5Y10DRAFT_248105 [Nemania abortiva]|nr:hypothetical protein F5Y10DRAFT_248105 [Nemania abortiva]